MESVIDQALGDVHRAHAFFQLPSVAENHFVHGRRGVREIVDSFEALSDVVCVENRVFRGLPQAIGAIRLNISQRAHEHSKVAVESAYPSHRLRTVALKRQSAVRFGDHHRRRQERLQAFLDSHRARTRASAAVWSRESLVQVEMHDVDAEVAGAHLTDQRVHVGAVHIEKATFCMQDVGNLMDVLLEHAQRVGIREHEGGDIFIHLRRQRGKIDHTARVRL